MSRSLREGRALLRGKRLERLLPHSDSYVTGGDVLRHLDGPTERQKLADMFEARPVGTHYVMTAHDRETTATALGWRHKRQLQRSYSARMTFRELAVYRWCDRLDVVASTRHLHIERARERAFVTKLEARKGKASAKAKAARERRKLAAMAASEAARQERMVRQGMAVAALMRGETND